VLRANPKTIVVNQSGSAVTMPWVDEASTVLQVNLNLLWAMELLEAKHRSNMCCLVSDLQAFYGGNELGNGLADVISGKVNPSAKLSLTFP
jgi:beta-glucosidase